MASSLPRRQDATLPPAPADDAVGSAVAQLVGSAPETLDTLGELAAALTADEGTAATLAALIGTKAPLASPAFTGTVTGVTAGMVGLGAVDNTPDSAKPVSTAQQAALNTKASTASPAFTGIVTGITAAMVAADPAGAASTAQAAAVQRANHTGTQTADTLTDGVLNKAYTGTERTKLAGVATGATANSADSALLNRANHTGTQAATTVTGLAAVATSGAYADLTGKPANSRGAGVSHIGTVSGIGSNVTTAVQFTNTDLNDDSTFFTANTSGIILIQAGLYILDWSADISGTTAGIRTAFIQAAGVTIGEVNDYSTGESRLSGSRIIRVTANTQLTMSVVIGGGGSLLGSAAKDTSITCAYLGA